MMVPNGRGNPHDKRVTDLAHHILCPSCGTTIPLPSDTHELRWTQLLAGAACNLGFFAMLALRAVGIFTLDWFWVILYIVGVVGYALVVSKALTVKLKHFEMQLPMGGKIEGGIETTSTETTVHQVTHQSVPPPKQ